jgi:multidrug efflux system outer membrane protein
MGETLIRGVIDMKIFIILILAMALFSGCAIGPDYKRPLYNTPTSWSIDEKETRDVANTLWWEQFNDPVLNDLIQVAIRQNTDLKIAAARVEEYLGYYWVGRSGLFPHIFASGAGGQQRGTENGQTPIPASIKNPATVYHGVLNGTWEMDVWGRLRRATEAARASLLATEEGKRAIILSLVTTVANNYINLCNLDKQLEISIRTAKLREDSYNIFKLRFEGGIISELELSQIKSEYEQALARIPLIEKQITQQENVLNALLGKNPGRIARGKTIDRLVFPAIPSGVPSDVLEQRPDIKQAEQNLIAANARIGVARALYFPTISLTGNYGWESTNLANLFSGPSGAWNWAAGFSAPIFTGGSVYGQNIAAEAIQQQALFGYQKAIQNAFRDVENALIDQKKTREQLVVQQRQVDALRDYARIARLRYDNGYTSYIEVLDAERSLFNAELDYAQTQGGLFQAFINIYKSMGGGWIMNVEKMTAVTQNK